MAKYLDNNGLLYLWSKIKAAFVQKDGTKVLSTNDYTTTEKNKLAGLSNYTLPTASAETLGGVKVGTGLAINNGVLSASGGGTADAVDWSNVQNKPETYPPDTHTHSDYQTAAQVTAAINSAVSGITGISFEVVSSLPASGTSGRIYLVSNSGDDGNIYDEYIYYNSEWEKIGTTAVDLSGYLQTTDVIAITNAEIDTVVAS